MQIKQRCTVCDRPATVQQDNSHLRVATFRCDDCALTDTALYRTLELRQAKHVRLADTQARLHRPGRMFA